MLCCTSLSMLCFTTCSHLVLWPIALIWYALIIFESSLDFFLLQPSYPQCFALLILKSHACVFRQFLPTPYRKLSHMRLDVETIHWTGNGSDSLCSFHFNSFCIDELQTIRHFQTSLVWGAFFLVHTRVSGGWLRLLRSQSKIRELVSGLLPWCWHSTIAPVASWLLELSRGWA